MKHFRNKEGNPVALGRSSLEVIYGTQAFIYKNLYYHISAAHRNKMWTSMKLITWHFYYCKCTD